LLYTLAEFTESLISEEDAMLRKIESLFVAITFAEAGEHQEALSIMRAENSEEALADGSRALCTR
jgi:hypothetical protein